MPLEPATAAAGSAAQAIPAPHLCRSGVSASSAGSCYKPLLCPRRFWQCSIVDGGGDVVVTTESATTSSSGTSTVQLQLESVVDGDTLVSLEAFDQCGGTGGNCKEFTNTACVDDVYSDVPCPSSHTCTRVNVR
jgi:hypothetical protein